jgi:hypothetical protein
MSTCLDTYRKTSHSHVEAAFHQSPNLLSNFIQHKPNPTLIYIHVFNRVNKEGCVVCPVSFVRNVYVVVSKRCGCIGEGKIQRSEHAHA